MEIKRYYHVRQRLGSMEYIKCHIVDRPKKRSLRHAAGFPMRVRQIQTCLYEVWGTPYFMGDKLEFRYVGFRVGFLKSEDDEVVWGIDGLSHIGYFDWVCLGDVAPMGRWLSLHSLASEAIEALWASKFTYIETPRFSPAAYNIKYRSDEEEETCSCRQLEISEIEKLSKPFKHPQLAEIYEN